MDFGTQYSGSSEDEEGYGRFIPFEREHVAV